ncbi:hypothetical protein [Sandaracinus amylolyticus]|uniref:hypothetical protein n=1 Tax=Sandaracinus amylolyticus TaxID=927083 RepID=UPI00069FD415|nr:hypothetical protein [Sandaracinus amylolyticus]
MTLVRSLLFFSAAVALCACNDGPLLSDRDGGVTGDAQLFDAEVAPVDGGDGGSRVDAGPPCVDLEPDAPTDPTQGEWESRFAVPGVGGDLPNVSEIAFGPSGEVYIAGTFDAAGYAPAKNVAVWTAAGGWRALGEGLDGLVRALAVDGATVWAAWSAQGEWDTTRLSRWDGTSWSEVAISEGAIVDLAIVESTLIAAGHFTRIGGIDAHFLARFDGTTWSGWADLAPDQGFETISARSLEDICVGGAFTSLGAIEARSVACWNGVAWSARSMPMSYWMVNQLTRDRDGVTLIAGGNFALTTRGELMEPAMEGSIARWTGDRWELIGNGVSDLFGGPGLVRGVAVVDHGLYVGGSFDWAGGYETLATQHVARWDGTRWHDIGGLWKDIGASIDENVWFVAAGPDGSVYFGGLFTHAGSTRASHVVRYDGTYWSSLRTPGERTEGIAGNVFAMDRVGTCALYLGGDFEYVGDVRADNVARYTREGGFETLGRGVLGVVNAIEATADGARVYAGGEFVDNDTGTLFANLASWDGARWSEVGGGTNGPVRALLHMLGEGADDPDLLFVGGDFTEVGGGTPANGLAVWDGESWTGITGLVGWHFDGAEEPNAASVFAIARDADTEDLYVAGSFARAGELELMNVARWDGEAWHALGAGLARPFEVVWSLVWWRDRLVAGGTIHGSGEEPIEAVAAWNGTAWENVGAGLSSRTAPEHSGRAVYSLHVHGDHLYAGGSFSIAPGEPNESIGVFDGTTWRGFAGGVSDLVHGLVVMDDGLYVGGGFARAGTGPSVGLAHFAFGGGER